MIKTETLEDFYKRIDKKDPSTVLSSHMRAPEWGHFNVYRRNDANCKNYSSYSRRDFYKISLISGSGTLYYADKGIEINGNTLLFSNPNVPYAWEALSQKQDGYFCLFSEDFVNTTNASENLSNSPLFRIGGNPVFFISDTQKEQISNIFEKMLLEIESEYKFKYDLIRNYMNLIIHEALKMQPAESYFKHSNASSRITSLFLELLERQFPLDSPNHVFHLRTANDFATRLSVHVNHLNRAVKDITGKTTTHHIAARIVKEAKALLKHTSWSIAEVSYCLGFDYPSHFNKFFKKHTGLTPKSFR